MKFLPRSAKKWTGRVVSELVAGYREAGTKRQS